MSPHLTHTEHSPAARTSLGMWVYIMSDCILFAGLFATYAVLHTATAGGPSSADLFDRTFVFVETLLLLTSSFTCGLALLASERRNKKGVVIWLVSTFILGFGFLGMELYEFGNLVSEGHAWTQSAFLSSFFTLVGTHGLHVALGGVWILALLLHVAIRGLSEGTKNGLKYFSLFWHFLDIVWICIFSFVYLFGTL